MILTHCMQLVRFQAALALSMRHCWKCRMPAAEAYASVGAASDKGASHEQLQCSTCCRDKALCSRCNAHVMQYFEWQQIAVKLVIMYRLALFCIDNLQTASSSKLHRLCYDCQTCHSIDRRSHASSQQYDCRCNLSSIGSLLGQNGTMAS